ncbi:hypothetical protein NQ315_005417, partial [Exocentrus adspersus]
YVYDENQGHSPLISPARHSVHRQDGEALFDEVGLNHKSSTILKSPPQRLRSGSSGLRGCRNSQPQFPPSASNLSCPPKAFIRKKDLAVTVNTMVNSNNRRKRKEVLGKKTSTVHQRKGKNLSHSPINKISSTLSKAKEKIASNIHNSPFSTNNASKQGRLLSNRKPGGKDDNANIHQKKLGKKELRNKFAIEKAAKTEILLTEDVGFLDADAGETTTQFTQEQIIETVDIASAAKHFELSLEFGPYRSKYTRNGRHLLLGGKKGHVAAFDWVTKRLHCEINVMESVHDISWLHLETMFAVAQKNWVYIYDNQGIELHCVKKLNKVSRMEFLPYHFLLGTSSEEGYLSWLDISIGQLAGQYNTNLGRLTLLTQNPWNATLAVGHAKGVVSFWAPTSRDPLAKMLCHKAPISALHIDPTGMYMATAATNRELKIWDVQYRNTNL